MFASQYKLRQNQYHTSIFVLERSYTISNLSSTTLPLLIPAGFFAKPLDPVVECTGFDPVLVAPLKIA